MLQAGGGLQTRDWKSQDWKTWDQIAGVEKTRLENTGTNFHGWKRRDWKTQDQISRVENARPPSIEREMDKYKLERNTIQQQQRPFNGL